jgi:hypothetical protein
MQMLVMLSGDDDIHAVENSAEGVRLRRLRAIDDRVYVAPSDPTSWSEEELAQAQSDDVRSGSRCGTGPAETPKHGLHNLTDLDEEVPKGINSSICVT